MDERPGGVKDQVYLGHGFCESVNVTEWDGYPVEPEPFSERNEFLVGAPRQNGAVPPAHCLFGD